MPTIEHTYHPRGTAKDVFAMRDPEILVSGPAGTGKSRACLEKLNLMALLNPGMRGLIVRKTASSLTSTALVTWREYVVPELLASGELKYYGGSGEKSAQYIYKNGSTITTGGMDKPTKVMSSEYDVIYVQEATELTETDWESLTTRLRNGRVSFQQMIADCNPDTPTHWLLDRAKTGALKLINARHEDNPRLFNEDGTLTQEGTSYISKLDALTGVRYQRLRKGLWVAAEGIIFEEYEPTVHLVDEMPAGWENWQRYWSVDFGYTNPFVCQFWAESPDGELYLYREIYKTKRTVYEHAQDILAIVRDENERWIEPKPRAIICDHDAEGREVFKRAIGIPTAAAKKNVLEGIQAVQKRFKDNRLFILRSCLVDADTELVDAKKPTCTADELPGYVWDDKKTKEAPVKENDHGCDALRYMVVYREVGGRPNFRMLR